MQFPFPKAFRISNDKTPDDHEIGDLKKCTSFYYCSKRARKFLMTVMDFIVNIGSRAQCWLRTV